MTTTATPSSICYTDSTQPVYCTSCNPPSGCSAGWICTNDWTSCLSSNCCAKIQDSSGNSG